MVFSQDIVKLLVKHGANLDAKTSINALSMTPLMYAAGVGHLGIVRCLVNAGATVEFRGQTWKCGNLSQFSVSSEVLFVESAQNLTPEKSQGGCKAQHVMVTHPFGDHTSRGSETFISQYNHAKFPARLPLFPVQFRYICFRDRSFMVGGAVSIICFTSV